MPTDSTASPRERLQRMSRWMRALIALGALGLVAFIANIVFDRNPGTHEELLRHAPSAVVGLFVFWQAWTLFAAYGRGQVFGVAAIRPLRRIAWALLAQALVHPLSNTLAVLAATWHNPPGQRQLQLGVSFEDYLCVLFGGLLIAMAWAMTEASRIEQDNAGFV